MTFAPIVHVVAFDGQVVDTLTLRARALEESLLSIVGGATSAAVESDVADTVALITGRDFAETARLVLERRVHEQQGAADELETLIDFVVLDASRRYSRSVSHGVSLVQGAAELLSTLRRTGRVVARADSVRRDVDAIMALGALEHEFMFIRCSDDAPRLPGGSTFAGSMAAIAARLRDNRTTDEVPGARDTDPVINDASTMYHP
ncbi:MAG TPA: hypothetical protein VE869_02630 [Gemmatimonas sp.]|nr:hypothetical protein [Gemmatimonas sp.]